ncbi:MAG: helix-turn-helix transcriptional regulator [Subdoligranulum sp.]|nr:helix-turn-helix transcriptional regulator [Subdoligranulum sp.]
MAIGERIHFFRNLRGMTQKHLGMLIGFPERSADVRLAQYESGTRTPKADLTAALAQALDVAPQALSVPDIDSEIGLMHTLFALEDIYGLHVDKLDGEVCIRLDRNRGTTYLSMLECFSAWQEQSAKLAAGEISKEDYDQWRYCYPKYDATQIWAKVPSQELSDVLIEHFKDKLKDE